MNNKGIAIGQVFIFIVAALTFALVMIFGYQAITQFLDSGEDVAFVQFKTRLESSVKKIYTEFGAVRVTSFTTPAKYNQVCFVDMSHKPDAKELDELCQKDPLACAVWEDAKGYGSVDENVFLTPPAPVKIKVFDIRVDEQNKNHLCLPIRKGQFSIILEGKGSYTALSKVPPKAAQ